MKNELDKSVTCSKCANFTFCMAKNASDSFVGDVMKTGLFRGEDSIGGLEMYTVLANACRKFVDEVWEKDKEKKRKLLLDNGYVGLIHKDGSCSCKVGALLPVVECKECFQSCKVVKE